MATVPTEPAVVLVPFVPSCLMLYKLAVRLPSPAVAVDLLPKYTEFSTVPSLEVELPALLTSLPNTNVFFVVITLLLPNA